MRTQNDGLQEQYSENGALDCSGDIDRARQELKDDADVNKLLAKFGVGVPLNAVQYGVQFDKDLQDALESINTAREAYRNLTPEVRRKYPTWQSLLIALESGAETLDIPKTEDTPVPPIVTPTPVTTDPRT